MLLSATIGIIFAWVEPVSWVIDLDVGNESDLVDWSHEEGIHINLALWSIDLIGKTLSDGAGVRPDEFSHGVTLVSDTSRGWWLDSWSKSQICIVLMPPLPLGDLLAAIVGGSASWVAFAIFNAGWSMQGDVVFLAIVIGDVFVD